MPTKRSYDVEKRSSLDEEQKEPLLKHQEYFKSYVCMVLVILVICLIFFLIALFITNKVRNVSHSDIESEYGSSALEYQFLTTINYLMKLNVVSTIQTGNVSSTISIPAESITTPRTDKFSLIKNDSTQTENFSDINSIPEESITTSRTYKFSPILNDSINLNGVTTTQKGNLSSTYFNSVESITTSETDSNISHDVTTQIDNISSTNSNSEESITTTQTDKFSPIINDSNISNDVTTQIDNISSTYSNSEELITTTQTNKFSTTISDSNISNDATTQIDNISSTYSNSEELITTTQTNKFSTTISDSNISNDVTTQIDNISSTYSNSEELITTTQTNKFSTTISDSNISNDVTTQIDNISSTYSNSEESITTIQPNKFSTTISDSTTNSDSNSTSNSDSDSTTNSDSDSTTNSDSPPTVLNFNKSTNLEGNNKSYVCRKTSCHFAATKLSHLIDQYNYQNNTVCNNFYEFTCRQRDSFRSNKDVFQNYNYKVFKKSLDQINKTVDEEKFERFYGSCVEHNALIVASNLSQIYEEVKNYVGGFILDDKSISDEKMHITNLIAKMMLLNHAPLFDVDLVLDANKKYIFKVIPPKFKIHPAIMDICKLSYENHLRDAQTLSDFYIECIYNRSHSDIYANQMDKILNEVHALDDIENVTSKNALISEIKLSFKNYYELFQNFTSDLVNEYSEKEQGLGLCSVKKTIRKWNANINDYCNVKFDWDQLFKSLTGKNISLGDYEIKLYSGEFIKELFNTDIKLKDLHNLLIATFLRDYYIELMSPEIQTTRDKYCLEKTIKLHPEVASEIYEKYLISNHIKNISKLQDNLTNIFNNIKNTFNQTVQTSIGFNSNMQQTLSKILNEIQLEFYKPFKLDEIINYECEKYLECFIKASKEFCSRKYMAWNTTITETNYIWSHTVHVYDMDPVTVYEAYKIAIPYGMFYGYNKQLEELPYYIIMATVGRKLAYHLGNYFSLIGLGLLRNQMNFAETIEGLHEFVCGETINNKTKEYDVDIVNCIENNYKSEQKLEMNSESVTFSVLVKYFINQIISDGSAIRLAYDTAFTKRDDNINRDSVKLPRIYHDYTDEKLFYFSAVQEFCDSDEDDLLTFSNKLYLDGTKSGLPNQVRVLDFLRSDSNFASVFNCEKSGPYNLERKCTAFPYLKNYLNINRYPNYVEA